MSNEEKFKVTLGEYKGLKAKRPQTVITDEELEATYRQQARMFAQKIEVTSRPVNTGDIATIDFTGYINNEAFDGGAGTDYPLEIGSGTFIPGFEEQLIGAVPGEEVNVLVTFPEEYGAPHLAGKPAIFKVVVKKIEELHVPELDAAVRLDIKARLEEQKTASLEAELEGLLIDAVIENSEIEIPDEAADREAANLVNEWKFMMKSRGVEPEQYFEATGMDELKLKNQLMPKAVLRLQTRLVLEGIAQTEELGASPEEVDVLIAEIAAQYRTEVSEIRDRFTEDHIKALESDVRMRKAIDLIKSNAEIIED